jgi:hypothetical protein
MKVLLVCDGEYRLYTEATANAIRTFRPDVEVAFTDMGELEAAVERLDPQLVIAAGTAIPKNPIPEKVIGYIELSLESDGLSRFRVGERGWESTNPALGEILLAVDEGKRLYRRNSHIQEPTETIASTET